MTLIVGMGGLGCVVGAELAGAGAGQLRLVDHDVVDISNLHRQLLYRESDIGCSKAMAAKRELEAINSQISVQAEQIRLSPDNVLRLIEGVDLVIDAADNFPASYLLSDACLKQRIPLVSASVNRSFGYVGIFCGTAKQPAPSIRALFPTLPREQMSCDTVGVTGPGVGIIASLQAQEALKVLLDDEHQLLGKLLYVDLWQYKMHTVDFNSAKEPDSGQIEMIDHRQISTADTVIDVREAGEILVSPQPFETQLQIPLADLVQRIAEIPASGNLICACRSGQRALIAAQLLLDNGHSQVAALLPIDEPTGTD